MTNGTINDMEAKRSRGKLFTRPEKPREISITDRNVAHLKHLSRLRLCSTAQLAALDGGSSQKVERALLGLWENGYIERPESQVTSRRKEKGSRPLIYGLSRKGASYLRSHGFEVTRPLLDGIDKHKAAGWRFIEHSVGISGFFVQLELATRSQQGLRILERAEIFTDAPTPVRRVRLEARIPINGSSRRCTVIPDGFFGLRFAAAGEESYFMYEKDRGEMPVTRFRTQYGTYVAKKLHIYLEASRQRKHVNELGIPNFRVLIETTTRERVVQMIEALEELTSGRGSNLFLFIDEATLAGSDPLNARWVSGKRNHVRLVD
ncbi:replication-relaxation family protein [Bradyrhizobium sp. AUGA SZCCT0176]|uniref:replication-relaxation family protein n=1 Tax=Bradyrhizobium sp. AUGA SZCCT0176 TaxID=2807664 RepID=UPI001BA8CB85|nr:replication-relaxation family protein [Bradyrhizobium sp. AUGA SZCCT0176]MBR1226898.1 replication-relaxation family protein [Bradyrhizobium sp. AUGA SZCCT0176]